MSIHDRCEMPAATPDRMTELECMRSAGHSGVHRDTAEGYIWTDVTTPEREI